MTSLLNACRTAIKHQNTLADIIVPRWADTFQCSEADVMTAWESALTEITHQPQNACEVPDGK